MRARGDGISRGREGAKDVDDDGWSGCFGGPGEPGGVGYLHQESIADRSVRREMDAAVRPVGAPKAMDLQVAWRIEPQCVL